MSTSAPIDLPPAQSAGSSATAAPPRAVDSAPEPRPRRLRLAILGDSPCDQCTAACCKQNGHAYAALLAGDEVRKFAAFSVDAPIHCGGRVVIEKVLPYIAGRCQFLGDDDRCAIYDDRPASCRQFQCVAAYNAAGIGAHGPFLQRNPHVRELLDRL